MKRMNKKGLAPILLLIIGIIMLGAAIYSGNINTGEITGSGGGYIQRPVFKYIKCEALSGLKYSASKDITSGGDWLSKPSVSSSYNIKLKINNVPGLSDFPYAANKIIYSVCNSKVNDKSNCRVFNQEIDRPSIGQQFDINDIKNNEFVFAKYVKYNSFSTADYKGMSYQIGFVPYGLREYDTLSAPQGYINSNDCSIPNIADTKDQVISTNSQKAAVYVSKYSNQNIFQPEELRWYVTGYVASLSDSFLLNYKGQDAWCRDGKIYKVNTITTTTGSYKIASPDYSDYLASVTCCPKSTQGSQVCNDNFQWTTIGGSECSAFKSCGSPNFVPYSEAKLIRYSCVDGFCKSELKDVECSSDYDCKDSNKICDLGSYTCKDANVNLQGQVIKTIPSNQDDCDKKGGTWVSSKSTESTGALCISGFGLCTDKVIVNEYCDMGTNWDFLKIFLYIILGIAVLFILRFAFPVLRGTLKGVPIIGRIIP
jgi:hypothetical protein